MITTYAVKTGNRITVRALPSMQVAQRIAGQTGGRAIIDPRSVTR
jgi:hypothetical protein